MISVANDIPAILYPYLINLYKAICNADGPVTVKYGVEETEAPAGLDYGELDPETADSVLRMVLAAQGRGNSNAQAHYAKILQGLKESTRLYNVLSEIARIEEYRRKTA